MYKILYLPIEIKSRELDAKLLIALEVISKDYIVIIGTKAIHKYLEILPKGVFFYKDASFPMEDKFKRWQQYGHKIVVHDEEGIVQSSWNDYLTRRIKFNTINYVDIFFCWGKKQFDVIEKYTILNDIKCKLSLTGHSRIDLLREGIRNYSLTGRKKKNVILINTELGQCNHRNGPEGWLDILKEHNMIQTEEALTFRLEQREYKKELLNYYIKLIKLVSTEFSDCEIILRPHPTENVSFWREKLSDFNNVIVTNKGPIGKQITQSDIIIHTGCTTGIEAFLQDKPVISFKPLEEKRFDIELPDSISLKAYNIKKCLKLIKSLLSNDYDLTEYKEAGYSILSNNITSLEGKYAYKKISEEIISLDVDKFNFNIVFKVWLKKVFILRNIKELIKKVVFRNKIDKNRKIYKKDIEETIKNLQKVTSLNDKVKVTSISEDIYMLWKSND
jgi:surface carbohydrate biosynthesis protein